MQNPYAKYGLTIAGYKALLTAQNGLCAICKRHQNQFKKRLAVDHDHATGRVRSLLCQDCNIALGLIKDNREIARSMEAYLDGHGHVPEPLKMCDRPHLDRMTDVIDGLREYGLNPTSMTFDNGKLTILGLQSVAAQGEQEQEEKERKELPRRPVSAIESLRKKHPAPWDIL